MNLLTGASLLALAKSIYYDKRVSGNIHRQSGRHFDVENVRSSNPTAFVW